MIPRVGEILSYNHPDWGQCRGKVIRVEADRVLVQDLSRNGAREWWPIAGCTTAQGNQ